MGQNTRRDPRAKVLSMTVRYRSATLGEFIEHHSYDVSRGGMFIKTPSPFPAGTLLKFEVKIAEEQRVMQGVGRVVWKRDTSHASADEPAGMGIKFIKIDDGSRAVIERLLDSRGGGTLGAFDKAPEAERMFPEMRQIDLPAPEDRTVIRPASELLEEALRKTAEDPVPSSRQSPSTQGRDGNPPSAQGGFEPVRAATQNLAAAYVPDLGDSEPPPPSRIPSLESVERAPRSIDLRGPSSAKVPAPSSSARALELEEESGGRTLFLFLAVAAVAVGIWVLTKRGGSPERDPPASHEVLTSPAVQPRPTMSPVTPALPRTTEPSQVVQQPAANNDVAPPAGSGAQTFPAPAQTSLPVLEKGKAVVPLLRKRKPTSASSSADPASPAAPESTGTAVPDKPVPPTGSDVEPSADNPY